MPPCRPPVRPAALLAAALLVAGCLGSAESVPEAPPAAPALDFRPNILWLVAEDQSADIPPFGDSTIATPTLSRLAAEGVRYTHVFSPSGVCAPSRAALATGMYPTRIGAHHMRTGPWVNANVTPEFVEQMAPYWPEGVAPYEAVPPADARMHAELLRRAGYYTTNDAKHDYQFRAPVTAWDESAWGARWRGRAPGQPFFSIVNFEVTHESRIWSKADDSLWVDADLDVPVPPYLPDTEVGRRDVRRMYSNIREMDAQVGAVLAELEADGLLDSTIVFWYADHGGPLPRQKRLLYDSGLHVPLIVRFPGAANAGAVDDRLVSFVDFLPTLLSLAGEAPPEGIDGRAFLGPYRGPDRAYIHAASDRFDERYDMIRAVRDHRFKYLRNYRPAQGSYLPVAYREQMPIMQELLRLRDAGALTPAQAQWFRAEKPEEELFDTVADPHELRNLAGDPAYADRLAELRAENERWMAETNDRGLVPEPEFRASIWPGGEQPVTAPPAAERTDGRVSLTSSTEGASIGWQRLTSGGAVGEDWAVYTAPVSLAPGERLAAVAHRLGWAPSDTVYVDAE